jgi:small subunit ribosomal protein S9
MTATTPTKKPAGRKPAAHKPTAPRKPRAVHAPAKEHAKPVPTEVKHVESAPAAEVQEIKAIPHGKHFYAVGRRKTAVTQVMVTAGNGTITINKLPFEGYFQTSDLQQIVRHPMVMIGVDKTLNIKAKVQGGGIHAQAESMRHAISRALIEYNPDSRRTLKKLGFLTRDPRVKERKKPGLKRARRAPQFSKR